jgi:GT2 family glycosyltransferase
MLENEDRSGVVPGISVIVPCYRDALSLGALLRSLAAQEPPVKEENFEVIVVDSGMDDEVVRTAERAGTRCVRGEKRLLAGDARNLGALGARGAVLAFIDSDCVAEPGWISALSEALQRGAFMVGGPVLNRHAPCSIASIDNLLQFADFGPARQGGSIRHVPSCNMAIRRDDFSALGGFVHRGQPSGEDVLLTEAANAMRPGGVVFAPGMRVAHEGRGTLGAMLDHQHSFGTTRGALGLHLSTAQQRWGRSLVVLPAVVVKRLKYVCRRGVRYGRISPVQLLRAMPFLLLGVCWWALGFRGGLRVNQRLRSTADSGR